MKSTFVECKECKKHWFNGTGMEMCDNDWNCLEHEELHRTNNICIINWHPYPQEKPKESGMYIITLRGDPCTNFGFWFAKEEFWSHDRYYNMYDWLECAHITAWAEMPKPYGEEA